ncbi:MAG TPA: glycosyltransferase family 2 protein [Solirubrobacteraceae bacterium]|nr:glycosyltransferase family 2 protein [Solirubrobacteraceae bacterium]
MPDASVTLVVLSYNGRDLLAATLASVLSQAGTALVVDNGSDDGTAGWLRATWPQVRVLELPENVGVAAALNRAIAATSTEFVALLNNDVELAPGWLDPLLATLVAHPEAASATGKLLRYDDRERLDAAGDVLLRSAAVINRGAGELDRGQYDRPEAVFGACAGAALYRRAAFDTVGPFDETYFAYLEDVDWSMRAQLAGFAARYEPAAVGFHMGGATTRRKPGFYGRLQRRNQLLLVAKTFPAGTLARHGWRIAGTQLVSLASSAREGELRSHASALGEAARMLPAALRRRRALQRRRRAPVREVERMMAAGVPSELSRPLRVLFELAPGVARRRSGLVR